VKWSPYAMNIEQALWYTENISSYQNLYFRGWTVAAS
jgi:hypothetical protein